MWKFWRPDLRRAAIGGVLAVVAVVVDVVGVVVLDWASVLTVAISAAAIGLTLLGLVIHSGVGRRRRAFGAYASSEIEYCFETSAAWDEAVGGAAAGSHPASMLIADPDASKESACYVNAFVAPEASDVPVSGRPLELETRYEVVCNIGFPDERSLLPVEDAVFPRQFLPEGSLKLRAVLHVAGSARVEVGTLDLSVGDEGSHWARLPLPAEGKSGTVHAQLAIYYEVVAVHVQAFTLPFGGPVTRGGPSAQMVYRLSSSFADLGKLKDRHASVVLTDQASSSSVLVNGLTFAPNAFAIAQNAADIAVRVARYRMYDTHFRGGKGGKEINLYSVKDTKDVLRHGKPRAEFEKDLVQLAGAGHDIYDTLFRENIVAGTLPDLLRWETEALDRVPVIQVVDPSERHLPIPWALLYDLPFSGSGQYEPCPSIAEFGPGGEDPGEIPARCPYEDRHRATDGRWRDAQLCPWGFWGLSAILEHPPYVDRNLEGVVAADGITPSFLVAVGTDLDKKLSSEHISALDRQVAVTWNRPPIYVTNELRRELGQQSMDVIYLYCHCDYVQDAPGVGLKPHLRFDDTAPVTPAVISAWATSAAWPYPHWPDRHPLVVINGCRTVELQSGSLAGFVEAFTNRAGAAGVIGTEITIDQGVAGWAMELFLTSIAEGATVGMALRQARWAMLRRGNLMGFAYTPYCLAGLALRRYSEPTRTAA